MRRPIFYPGWHQPSDLHLFAGGRMCIHINRFRRTPNDPWRKFAPAGAEDVEVLLDANTFTEITLHGRLRLSVQEFADAAVRIVRWFRAGAAVSQDHMCEAAALRRTGLDARRHQELTTQRYVDLRAAFEGSGVYLMPVLQGAEPEDYARHAEDYGALLAPGAWVGVGSVCKLNGRPEEVVDRVAAIRSVRPDLRLHGFGQKVTAAAHPALARWWYSMDSLASSKRERMAGTGRQNDPGIVAEYAAEVEASIDRGLSLPWSDSGLERAPMTDHPNGPRGATGALAVNPNTPCICGRRTVSGTGWCKPCGAQFGDEAWKRVAPGPKRRRVRADG